MKNRKIILNVFLRPYQKNSDEREFPEHFVDYYKVYYLNEIKQTFLQGQELADYQYEGKRYFYIT